MISDWVCLTASGTFRLGMTEVMDGGDNGLGWDGKIWMDGIFL